MLLDVFLRKMKCFFNYQLKNWKSPLEIFPFVKDESPHLFFSGNTEDENIAGRYSFIPFSPVYENLSYTKTQEFFLKLSDDYKRQKQSNNLENWKFPFCGGIAGVFSYDFLREIEDIQENEKMNNSCPHYIFGIYDCFFAFDHFNQECFIAGWFDNETESDEFFEKIKKKIKSEEINSVSSDDLRINFSGFKPEISHDEYEKKFSICQNEIEKGNSFQINFSQKFSGEILGNSENENISWKIFLQATKKNSAQMMYFYEDTNADFSIISCSPERLFSCDKHNNIFTQPIAGTCPRGKNAKEEIELEMNLTTSLKELSEHSMIVDLLRNDFGKVSTFGTVKVEKFMRVEKYATVMHLVSDISGKIAPQKNVFDVFESMFPGGTITGTPKKETMKILAKEEISSRDFYCGSAGYFSYCGSADWNILIRTLEKEGSVISGRAGGGLVYGANPVREYEETLHKFAGLKKIFE